MSERKRESERERMSERERARVAKVEGEGRKGR